MNKFDTALPLQDPGRGDSEDAMRPQLPQRVNSTALFGPSRELIIVHNSRECRLRLTQNGKLILTA